MTNNGHLVAFCPTFAQRLKVANPHATGRELNLCPTFARGALKRVSEGPGRVPMRTIAPGTEAASYRLGGRV